MWTMVAICPDVRRLLDQAADCEQSGQFPLCHALYQVALASDGTPLSRIRWAKFLLATGASERAIPELLIAWEQSKGIGDSSLVCECCRLLSLSYSRTGESELEWLFQQRAIKAALDAIENGASFHHFTSLLEDAAQSASARSHQAGDSQDIETWIRRGEESQGRNPAQALEYLREAWRLAQIEPGAPEQVRVLQAMVAVLCSCGNWFVGARIARIAIELEAELRHAKRIGPLQPLEPADLNWRWN